MERIITNEECGVWVPVSVAARLKNVSPLTIKKRYYMNEVQGLQLSEYMLVVCLDDIAVGSGKVGRPGKLH